MRPAAFDKRSMKEHSFTKCSLCRSIVFGLAGSGICLFFLPCVSFVLGGERFIVSGWELLTGKGFLLIKTENLLVIPAALRCMAVLWLLCLLSGSLCFLLKKTGAAAGCFAAGGIVVLLLPAGGGLLRQAVWELTGDTLLAEIRWSGVLASLFAFAAAGIGFAVMGKERAVRGLFLLAACVSLGTVCLIVLYLAGAGMPALREIGLKHFFFGREWSPRDGRFGILPMLLSTLLGTAGALVISAPLGVLTAVFLTEYRMKWVGAVRMLIELMAGIPSVVYGFFGMLCVVPLLRSVFDDIVGDSLLAAVLILSMMVTPTIVTMTEDAIRAVPERMREGSLALGAGEMTTVFRVVLPCARRGILSGVLLGVGRAMGETMAVLMVAGNAVHMPRLFSTVRFLTTGIAMELSYASGMHRQALFAMGFVLLLVLLFLQTVFFFLQRSERRG